jgi:predicted XRE-type DNA-binding protein
MAKKPLIGVAPSSGNVFADIGVADPEEALAKAQLASRIREALRRSRLTQVAAAAVMGIDEPKVSALLNGRLTNFSSERLMRLLTRLGQDVEIVVRTKPRRRILRKDAQMAADRSAASETRSASSASGREESVQFAFRQRLDEPEELCLGDLGRPLQVDPDGGGGRILDARDRHRPPSAIRMAWSLSAQLRW